MIKRPSRRTMAAFLRLLEARLATAGVGLFELRSGRIRLWAGSDRLAPHCKEPSKPWMRLDPRAARLATSMVPVEIDPAAIGLTGGTCLIQALREASGTPRACIVVVEPEFRYCGTATAAALADGAAVLAALLDPRPPAVPRSKLAAMPEPNQQPMIEPVAFDPPQPEVHRLIAEALNDSAAPKALVLLDLDRFRAVNEALGTKAGDALLAAVAARLDRIMSATDRLVRLKGDRFAIVTRRRGSSLVAHAQMLLDRVGQPLVLSGQSVTMQACLGIVAEVEAQISVSVLLARAETALRRAKAERRDRMVLYEPRLDAAAFERSQLELELANAAEQGEMRLVYQPYIELGTGRVSGVEALLRWCHPRRGMVQPNAFIPLAEASGLILPLGNWMLSAACGAAAEWPGNGTLSVNISALQFHQPDFVAEIDLALAHTGFPASRLELEITETVLMRDNDETMSQLAALIERGIRIALDDFGTGYSALAYLARLPHHRIKLDRSFVSDLANSATAELVRAISAMAYTRGIDMTAEGVETAEQLDAVRALGFTHAQGFATGAPLSDPRQLFHISRVAAI